jgi:hypothetical protein
MTKRARKQSARPIKTRRDYEGAAAVAKRLSAQPGQDTAAELRLQSLLKELDRFDETEEEAEDDPAVGYEAPGPRRRWSDDATDAD